MICRDRDRLRLALHLPRFDLSQFEQVVGQPPQPQRVFANYFQKAVPVLRVVQRASEQRLRKTLNRR